MSLSQLKRGGSSYQSYTTSSSVPDSYPESYPFAYFANQWVAGRMDIAGRVAANEPIGNGVTEAACKVIVKQRLCGSGMKWTEGGAAVVLSLRTLSYTPRR